MQIMLMVSALGGDLNDYVSKSSSMIFKEKYKRLSLNSNIVRIYIGEIIIEI